MLGNGPTLRGALEAPPGPSPIRRVCTTAPCHRARVRCDLQVPGIGRPRWTARVRTTPEHARGGNTEAG